MGLSPREVDDLSLWQFAACVDGWMQAHGDDPEPLAPAEVKALSDWIDQPPVWMQ